jgi:signal transduction histidine kinase
VHRLGHVVIAGAVACVAAAEWLSSGGALTIWVWVAAGAGLFAAIAVLRLPPAAPRRLAASLAGAAVLILGAVLAAAAVEVRRIECCWPQRVAAHVARDSLELQATLSDAVREARRLAERGRTAALLPRAGAFGEARRALGADTRGPERGLVITDAAGRPWVWAGRHRLLPAPDTAELRATITPFYVTLEARRQTRDGGMVVGTVLLDAAPAADRLGAVSAEFERRYGVALRFFAPGAAPAGQVVFNYEIGSDSVGSDTLFSVQPVLPGQGEAKLAALARWSTIAGLVLVLAVALLLIGAPPGPWRWALLAIGAWVLARAPLGPSLRLASLFSPATFYRPWLGPFGASAGSLTVASLVLLVAAGAWWRRGATRRPWSLAAAALLVLAAPYLLRSFGRGIAPPAAGVSPALWMSWQAALATAGMALVLLAAALVRGRAEPTRVPWTVPAAALWAGLAGLAGLWLWSPYGAWPEWYTFLWLPALVGVIVPAPRRWALAGIAVVAGTAAALITWGATLEGRLALGERDANNLGRGSDPLAVALLERLGRQAVVGTSPPPTTASGLYALWLESPLAGGDYPALLGLWSPDGTPRGELRLAELDLPTPLIAALARARLTDTAQRGGIQVERLERSRGVHYVLLAPLATGDLLAVGVGPRTLLMPPDRVARFLRGAPSLDPPYTITLSLPSSAPAEASPPRFWTRAGWSARGERRVDLPGGVRHVHVRVDLGGPWALLVRGTLAVLFDLALLAGAWIVGVLVAGHWRPRFGPALVTLRTSYRARLSAALAAFFIVPILAFAVWSFARLRDEARRAGDLLIRQTLRDAAVTAGAISLDRPFGDLAAQAIAEMGSRLDADLWLYRNGELAGTSSPVLGELGLVDLLLAPPVFQRLALEDELELAADGRTAGRPIRVGYRVVASGLPGEQAILAAPQLLDDDRVRRQQEDLVLSLILVTVAGLGAALTLAAVAARSLAKPVAVLRDAALAVGQGAAPPALGPDGVPREFEPVVQAFDRMARDVRRSQEALEEARRRTALVLANVATGVIAVEEGLRVTMANPRAAELLGADLEPGDLLTRATGGEWLPVWNAVAAYLQEGQDEIRERDFEIAGRQIRAQLAPLGPKPDGCVIALDDTSALARAARVLAWGEMARQVAHEIKNPLTPIRLGIQHLQRARAGGGGATKRVDFDATLEETAARILTEIDRLDDIARAFSRFGAPAAEQVPLEAVDLLGAAREVVQLYALGSEAGGREGPAHVRVHGSPGPRARARKDEVKEVLVNLLENARNAGAKQIDIRVSDEGRTLTVTDDGSGIPPEALPRVFEPTFSTTSSGSGLGLAIAKRLVESWGGTISLESRVGGSGGSGGSGGGGGGTTVTLTLPG